jgi:uncharacterized protein (DUF1800 family)
VSDGLSIMVQWLDTTPGLAANAALWAELDPFFAQEQQTMLANAVLTTAPFRERLVQFWANHFAVMATTIPTLACAGAFVRDAIRPHVTGLFSDMLVAVMQHPAMLYSLNNPGSLGPQSLAALAIAKASDGQKTADINENLGRETLELYTVGIAANYAQADVDAMACLLTGWTVNLTTLPYGFVYRPSQAQPGQQTLLGSVYSNTQGGSNTQAGCLSALEALATNPYTYQNLATKLVTHFTSDTPAASDVAAVAGVLSATGGNLGAAAAAVVALPNAWQPLTKLRTPQDLVVAALRASNTTAAGMPQMPWMLNVMGQPLWQPPFPDGWSDLAADWTGPPLMLMRSDCMGELAKLATGVTPALAAASSVGPFLSANTVAVMNSAALASDQLTLLFASPEFQRR